MKSSVCPYCGESMVKHIIKEGARCHVTRWDTLGAHCSEKNCERNHGPGHCVPIEKALSKNGKRALKDIIKDLKERTKKCTLTQ